MASSLIFAFLVLFSGDFARAQSPQNDQVSKVQNMKIKFTIRERVAVATLSNTPAARDFVSQLPLTLTFKDFASKEKIGYPPKKLSLKQDSKSPSEGDFAYYAPWGNIAVFYKGMTDATDDLLILGKFDSGKEVFNIPESFQATIEVFKKE